jgi:hypothetical protein
MRLLMTPQENSVTPKEWLLSVLDAVATKAAEVWAPWGAIALLVAVVAATAITVVRVVGGRKARSRRRAVLLKPSSKFDPSAEEILRFSGQLSRVHSATARFTVPRSTRMIRVRLVHAGEGRMAQLLEGPAAAEQILRHRGFAQVELADPAMVLSARASGPGSVATQKDSAEPSSSTTTTPVTGGGGASGAGVEDPLAPDLAVGAEDWVDTDHGGYLDDPPEELEWMHPEAQRLHPVPDRVWGCLDDEGEDDR